MHEELEQRQRLTWIHQFTLFAAVILPTISITVEATTHICAENFFDPIPSMWHLMLVVFVPLAQLQVWFAIRRGATERLTLAGFANAVSLGVSIFYSIVYIPLLPLAALALPVGLGLLPLTPFLSLLAGLVMRRQLKKLASRTPQKNFTLRRAGLLTGLGVVIAVIGLIEVPASLTRYGLRMAVSPSPNTRADGIRFLRSYGSRDFLLRSCYRQTGWATDLTGYVLAMGNPVTPTQAREIYYRVTGETFDTSAPPDRINGHLVPQDEFDFDTDQGGVNVGRKLKHLSLASSKLDASADADGGVAYMQWALVFHNDSDEQREARAEVRLPPGGVVSRLTLWVNGEEREAAFAGREQVRQAYQQVAIRQRRDPVLVTTAGRDRVMIQCFPVPPGGEMKIRLGITVPLLLEDINHARLLLPHFVNRNFRIPNTVTHAVWIEAKTPMTSEKMFTDERPAQNVFALRAGLPDTVLSGPATSVRLERSNVSDIWSKDPFETAGFIVRQSIAERVPSHLQRIVLVVDTSAAMSRFRDDIEQAIKSLPPDFDTELVFADADGINRTSALTAAEDFDPGAIPPKLHSITFAGGADNVPALLGAWDLAAAKPGNNAIVWIHSPQLLQLDSVEELSQRWERRPYGPVLYSVPVTAGSDEIEKKLDGINEVKSVPRMDSLQRDLERLFAQLTGQIKTLEFVRTSKKAASQPATSEAFETSDHLARLWANDEVARILSVRDQSLNNAATILAVRYQLVTPVSGAVVLETAEQYRAAGLEPVNPGSVPTIPEPEMMVLLIIAGAFVIFIFYIKYRNGGSGTCTV